MFRWLFDAERDTGISPVAMTGIVLVGVIVLGVVIYRYLR